MALFSRGYKVQLAPPQFFFRNNCTISETVYSGGESKKNYIPIHKVLEQPWRHFTSLKLCKCFQVPHPSPRVTATSSRTKTNHHWLNHLQTLHTYWITSLRSRKDCEGRALNSWGNTRKSWSHLSPSLPRLTTETKCKTLDSPSILISFSYTRSKKKNSSPR